VKSLQEVTSQEESFMPDISGYIRERVEEKAKYLIQNKYWVLQVIKMCSQEVS